MFGLGHFARISVHGAFYGALVPPAMRNWVSFGKGSVAVGARCGSRPCLDRIARACVPLLAAVLLAACNVTAQAPADPYMALAPAAAPTFLKPVPKPLLPPAAGHGRLYFYRPDNSLFPAIRPAVIVNGQKVGDSVAGEAFYRDAFPGRYEIFLTGDDNEPVTVLLDEGQTRYVRTSIAITWLGPRLSAQLVEGEQGQEELSDLMLVDPLAQREEE